MDKYCEHINKILLIHENYLYELSQLFIQNKNPLNSDIISSSSNMDISLESPQQIFIKWLRFIIQKNKSAKRNVF